MFDAFIEVKDNQIKITGNIKGLNEEVFNNLIKPLNCGKVVLNNEEYWVFKKGSEYAVTKLECLDKYIEDYKKQALYDTLTGCYNRGGSEEFLKKFLDKFIRYKKEPFSIIMLDIDFFKKINDTYGHQAGDEALKFLSSNIKKMIRESDIFGRIGGEEFLLILPDTKMAGAMKLAERIKDFFENNSFNYKGEEIKFTISMGITSVSFNDTIETILKRVDDALYEAKRKGRNKIEYR
ncbi:MAG: GGDEF domain-containing protein [Epsilonproteobacteria bacterium]|nr:GGDEF domain-containing protein [Campylobacterota bacterium]